jgi:periplasmic nitrate reductase NapD
VSNRKLSRRELLSLPCASADPEVDPLIHIASLLVQATPLGCDAVRKVASRLPGSEVCATANPNKLVVVLESADGRAIADAASELQQLAGVLTVSIVAHLTERASVLSATE